MSNRQSIKDAETSIMGTLESLTRRGRTQTSIVETGYMGKALRNLIERGLVRVVTESRDFDGRDSYNTITVSITVKAA